MGTEGASGRVGYAGGVYDVFHVGHLNILRQAKQRCDYLIAGVSGDDVIERTKGRRPLVPHEERMEIVRHISYVDQVHADLELDLLETWRELRFDIYFKGDDWKGSPWADYFQQEFAAVGVEVVFFPYTVHTSSTKLRAALDVLSGPPFPTAATG